MPTVKRWARVKEFNPNSPPQVLSYLRHRGYKIYKDKTTGKPTTDKTAIEKTLRTLGLEGRKDPLLETVGEVKKLAKAIGYLLEANLGEDGLYHPIYTFKPETGRLSAVRPNIMNQPNHGVEARVAHAIRACIIPSTPEKVLMEMDWKAMEAVLTGYFAQDEDYIRISKIDSHSYFCAHILKNRGVIDYIPSPHSDRLPGFLQDIKKTYPDERFMAKTANLAMGYDIGWRHLSEIVRCSAKEAKDYLRIRDEMFPKVAKWKENTFREAHKKGYLETPFGYRCYYWNVLEQAKGKPKGTMRKGREARDALAFRPQSSGAAMLREVKLDVAAYDGDTFDLLAPIHDALLVETYPVNITKTFSILKKSMERPWPELGGLSIEVEGSIGRTWGDMEPIVTFKGAPIIEDKWYER
jgi:DNA polymerase-1